MSFDPEQILARPPIVVRETVTPERCILYALGVGANELEFVYEERLRPLPTLPVVLATAGFFWRDAELGVDFARVLHGEQSIVLHRPIPVGAEIVGETRVEALYDRGAAKGAVAIVVRTISDPAGQLLATIRALHLLRGNGGFGGTDAGMPRAHAVPAERPPDLVHSLEVGENLALIYRLSGDFNPLHIDPVAARAAGFERPVLHGLATFGIAGRSLIAALMDNQPERMRRMDVRFSNPVYPGETVRTQIWKEAKGRASFRCWVAGRDKLVIDNGYVEFE